MTLLYFLLSNASSKAVVGVDENERLSKEGIDEDDDDDDRATPLFLYGGEGTLSSQEMSMSVCPVFGDVLSSIMDVVFGVKVGAVGGTESGIMVGSIVGTLLGKLDGANNTEGFVNSDVLSTLLSAVNTDGGGEMPDKEDCKTLFFAEKRKRIK